MLPLSFWMQGSCGSRLSQDFNSLAWTDWTAIGAPPWIITALDINQMCWNHSWCILGFVDVCEMDSEFRSRAGRFWREHGTWTQQCLARARAVRWIPWEKKRYHSSWSGWVRLPGIWALDPRSPCRVLLMRALGRISVCVGKGKEGWSRWRSEDVMHFERSLCPTHVEMALYSCL